MPRKEGNQIASDNDRARWVCAPGLTVLVVVAFVVAVVVAALYGFLHLRSSLKTIDCSNRLWQIGTVLRANGRGGKLPPAYACNEDGTLINSWRSANRE